MSKSSELDKKTNARNGMSTMADDRGDRQSTRTIFNDLERFKNSNVTIFFYGDSSVSGKLVGYDEVANCVLEREDKPRAVVLGRAITMICEGAYPL